MIFRKANVIGGTVESVNSIDDKTTEVVLKSQEWDRNASAEYDVEYRILFRDNLAKNVMKSKNVAKGRFISVSVKSSMTIPYEGISFHTSAVYKATETTDRGETKETTVTHGIIRRVSERTGADGTSWYRVDIPIDSYNSQTKKYETTWYGISFNDKFDSLDKVKKALTKGTHVMIRGGRININTTDDGRIYHNILGFGFRLCPKVAKKDTGTKIDTPDHGEPNINGEPAIHGEPNIN